MLEIYASIMLAVSCTLWLLVLMTSYSVYTYRVNLSKRLRILVLSGKVDLEEATRLQRERLEKIGAGKVRQTR